MKIRTSVTLIVFFGLTLLAYVAGSKLAVMEGQAPPWFSVIPPLLAVSISVLTHEVLISLSAAVIAGGFLKLAYTAPDQPSQWLGLKFIYSAATDTTNLQILAFVIFVMMMIGGMIASGGLRNCPNGS